MCVKAIVSQTWDIFLRHSVYVMAIVFPNLRFNKNYVTF